MRTYSKPMKSSNAKTIGIILIALGVLNFFTQPNFGFVEFTGAEALGYNLANIALPLIGVIFFLKGVKKEKKEKELQTKIEVN